MIEHGEAALPVETGQPAFDVVDVLGLCTLERRSATLGGSVPLRVAQACVPLLEGNAFGFQITLRRRIELRRKLGRFVVTAFEHEDEVSRLHRASVPMIRAEALLAPDSAWLAIIEAGVVSSRSLLDPRRERAPIALFTGLFVRPRAGLRLRQSSIKNRRSLSYGVREAMLQLDDDDRATHWIPIVLEIQPAAETVTLAGEIATLAVLPRHASFHELTLDDAPDVAHAHLRFYDRAYFETKRGGDVSRKYRREIVAREPPRAADDAPSPRVDCVTAGPRCVRPGVPTTIHGPRGPAVATDADADRLVFENPIPFEVTFDGLDVRVEPDGARLEAFAREVRARWKTLLDAAGNAAHPGALLYLTKYFTPHPPGEPHFFVKPSALVRTPAGTSMWLEGTSGDGFEVMRGIVKSDAFHAAPAVFQLTHAGRRVTVEEGTPLLEMFPVPRALVAATFNFRQAGPAALVGAS